MTVEDLVAAVARRTAAIVDALSHLDDASLREPSVLPGWDRLTIACHLRYGAQAFARMTSATLDGRPASYYPEGRQSQRPATLRPLDGETPREAVASLAASSAELDTLWRGIGAGQWPLRVIEPDGSSDLGPLPLDALVVLRLTEVEVHGLDLDLGLPDWSPVFVEAALPFRLAWLNTRRTNHREFDAGLHGSWLLVATDGPCHRVTVDGTAVDWAPARRGTPATATIECSSRDLLALLLGRRLHEPPRVSGDAEFAVAFTRAFPGP